MLHDILDDDHIQWHPPLIGHYTNFWPLLILTLWPNLTFYQIVQGFHRTYATGAACQQRKLTPPDTWSCPTLGLACVLMSRPISPELVLSLDFWISNTPRCFSFASLHLSKIFRKHKNNLKFKNFLSVNIKLFHIFYLKLLKLVISKNNNEYFWNMETAQDVLSNYALVLQTCSFRYNVCSVPVNDREKRWSILFSCQKIYIEFHTFLTFFCIFLYQKCLWCHFQRHTI